MVLKENRKGSSQSYNYNRLRVIIAFISLPLGFIIFTFAIRIRSYEPTTNSNNEQASTKLVGSLADIPIHQIDYGVQSTPLVMIRTSLDEELLKRFLEEHLYSCAEEELNNTQELDNRVKEPVYVYEGYYHSLQTSKNVFSRNPNPLIGKDHHKPAAGPFTRAFFDAFRVVNKDIFDSLRERLLEASAFKETQKEDVSYMLAKWIEQGHHFGDLSVQIHYGSGNEQKLVSGQAWHTDAANSLLHLAVTLRGERVLHSKRIQSSKDSTIRRPIRGQQPVEVLEKQNPGDAYLSSSTLMRHAPQFFDTDYESRSIAIHARFLYTSAEVNKFYSVRTNDSWDKMTNVLANTLSIADIQIPSLAQVESQLLHMHLS
ncbi:hypothetical protein QTG54_016439 [Skeletonema marinoi]|uniref:Uncharacterized protein n=1 Tax=Skeletonema marinoi TaxID=267567 RepID=A0AAD8XT56_9STRA|nr:hypothetical protein QTG54_016439 [Skeletonema marinoi]